ncbi:hypothetical protein AB0B28_08330 [Glycomyces sp. NPDC046736]|uniref:hypothetical protein n=1 Tax=Glycomyces sp. NPDC046736 TaxID=3155615 RepID=UPI0033EA0D32
MNKTTGPVEPVKGFDIAIVRGRPCYFIDDVPDVVDICRRQVDREVKRGHLKRIKRGQLTFIRIDEAHELRSIVEQRRKERADV